MPWLARPTRCASGCDQRTFEEIGPGGSLDRLTGAGTDRQGRAWLRGFALPSEDGRETGYGDCAGHNYRPRIRKDLSGLTVQSAWVFILVPSDNAKRMSHKHD